jgi:hypothetical protein
LPALAGAARGAAALCVLLVACGRSPIYPPPIDAAQAAPCDGGAGCDAAPPAACPAPFVACADGCVDPRASRAHCGARGDCAGDNAGAVCGAGEICRGGICAANCQAALVACDGTCVDPTTSAAHCGATGDCLAARAGARCAPNQLCLAGACAPLSCVAPDRICDGACVDPAVDPQHCGGCGRACAAGEACAGGVCVEARRCTSPSSLFQPPAPTSASGLRVWTDDLATDAAGDGFVTWEQWEGGFVSRFDRATKLWSAPTLFSGGGFGRIGVWTGNALVAAGNAAYYFDEGAGAWAAPLVIDPSLYRVAVDGHGNVILAGWDRTALITSTFDPIAGSVSAPDALEMGNVGPDAFALDAAGNLLMVSGAVDDEGRVEALVRFDAAGHATGAGAPFGRFAPPTESGTARFTLVVDGAENAVAAWDDNASLSFPSLPVHPRAQRYTAAASAWADVPLALDDVPLLAAGLPGQALLVWRRSESTGVSLWASGLAPGEGAFADPVLISDRAVQFVSNMAANRGGDAAVASIAVSGGVWLHRFRAADQSWSAPELVFDMSPQEADLGFTFQVAVADGGAAFVAVGSTRWVRVSYCAGD